MRARIFSYNPSTIRSDHLMALKHKVDVSPNAQSWWFLLSEEIIMKTGQRVFPLLDRFSIR